MNAKTSRDPETSQEPASQKPLRSKGSFDNPDNPDMTALYLERYMNFGLSLEELQSGRPIIGIAQTGSDLSPCNRHHIELAKRVWEGIRDAGGIAIEFPVHPIQETGKRPTAGLDRNLSYLGLVEVLYGYPLDGVVLTIGCDKTTPACLMAAATVNIPAIALSVGPMLNGWFRGERTGSGTIIWKARELLANGEIDHKGFLKLVASSAPSAGYCNTMGTATTMNSLAEALGMQLPGAAAIPAPYRDRQEISYETGLRIVEMVREDLKPSDILTREAFINAIRVNSAIGGSTNAPIHLNALARHVGVELEIDDWQSYGEEVPLLVNLQPAGEYLGEDYYHAGGVPAVIGELIKHGLIDTSVITANGLTIGENYASSRIQDEKVIRPFENPIKERAGFRVLRGNLFPSAIMKTSVISREFREHYLSNPDDLDAFEGRAIVFDGPEDYHARIDDPTLAIDFKSILFMRGAGPIGYPGAAEVVNMRAPDYLLKHGISSLPCIGDGRQSGTSGSPSILNASPEAAAGGALALLHTGDMVRIDLRKGSANILIDDAELLARRQALESSGGYTFPDSQTPWQEIQRTFVGQLETGAVLEPAVKYQRIAQTMGIPTRQPLSRSTMPNAKTQADKVVVNHLRLLDEMAVVVGKQYVLSKPAAKRRFIRGYRFGGGEALAVVRPGSLVEYWRVVQLCVNRGLAVIPQAANTGLTGGSVPFGEDYDRDVVVINTMRLKGLHLLGGGRQVVAFPGTTLNELEAALAPLGREPHSVIGSSCLGASVVGGICNNSGGSLIKRGPAYTEMALYAQVDDSGILRLVNHLGIALSGSPLDALAALERGGFPSGNVSWVGVASDADYRTHIRDIEARTPARFNADVRKLQGASGSAGKVIVFAVRVDTFEAEKDAKVFYVGTNDPGELTRIRRMALLDFEELPVAAEYIHRDAFDIAARYGKDTYLLVKWLGTARLPVLFSAKSRFDAIAERVGFLPAGLSDRLMQFLGRLLPSHLPHRLIDFRNRYEHHLMIKAAGPAVAETEELLGRMFPSASGAFFVCTDEEGKAAFLHRFATAGAAVRYRAVHGADVEGIVALDIALPRNEIEWMERLPSSFDERVLKKLYYGHFFCHVFHQDYIVRKGIDWIEVEHQLLALLDKRGAKYPAEHNVGHLYVAEPVVAEHYRKLDPCNCFNPGIGQTSKLLRWKSAEPRIHHLPSTGEEL